jgi:hypothetical protein
MKAVILNSPQGFIEGLGDLPESAQISQEKEAGADFVLLFVKNRAELDQFCDQALESVKYDGLLWVSYPKGSSKIKTDLNRDRLWEILSTKGIRPVAMVSIDDVWSAMRLRPMKQVGAN